MSIDSLLSQTATIEFYDVDGLFGTDRYGNEVIGLFGAAIKPCYLEQTEATEILVDRETYVSEWRLFLPAGTTIGPRDRVTIEGRDGVFEVVGPPNRLWNPRTRMEHHVEARLRLVIG